MTMRPPTLNPISPRLRFGADAKADNAAIGRLRNSIKDAENLTGDVVYVNVNQKQPDTPISNARLRIKKGIRAALVSLALLGVSVPGVMGVVSAQGNKPSASVVAQHDALAPSWEDLRIASRVSDSNNSTSQNNFNQKTNVFLDELITAMLEHPDSQTNVALYEEIQAQLKGNADFNPDVTAHRTGIELINYINNELNLPADPSTRDIEIAFRNFTADFINLTPALQGLSESQKTDFTNTVKQAVDRYKPGDIPLNAFDRTILAYIGGHGFAGGSLQDFENLSSEADAQRLLTSIINNDENFTQLNDNQRASFLEAATNVADSLEYPQQGYMLWALLALVGLGGAAAIAIVKRKDLMGLPGALGEVKSAEPKLIINNADRKDKDKLSELLRLEERIDANAAAMEEMLQTTIAADPAIKQFLKEVFGDQLPDAAWFKERHTRNAVAETLASLSAADRKAEKPVGELALKRRLAIRLDSAMRSGEILLVANKGDLSVAPADESLPPQQRLEQEKDRVETLIAESMKFYSNRKFAEVGTALVVQKLETRKGEVEDRLAELNAAGIKPAAGNETSLLLDEHTRIETDLPAAKLRETENRQLAHAAQKTVDEYVEPLRGYRQRIVQALHDADFNQSVEDLQKVQTAGGELQADPKLEEALQQQKVETFVREQQEASQRIADEVDAEVARELAAQKGEGPSK